MFLYGLHTFHVYIYSFIHIFTYILGKYCVVITLSIPIISVHVNECFIDIHSRSVKDNLSLHAYIKTFLLIQLTVEIENQSLMSIN